MGGFVDHLFYFIPLFGGTNVPYGKGHDHLASKRTQTREQLAQTQLAGIKLLLLAWLWLGVMELMEIVIYGEAGKQSGYSLENFSPVIFTLPAMILGTVPPGLPLYILWAGLFCDLIYATLALAVSGHFIIGTLRLFGFNLFRNTYKPLLAQSIVDFWNRFYYYFKELLVDFFFYPTFLTYCKTSPRLRMFIAIMAAAFVGNAYYHLLIWLSWGELSFYTGEGLATRLAPYLFYSFVLGLGVYISMVREQARRGKPQPLSHYPRLVILRRIAGVWLFFGLIRIWDVGAVATLGQRFHFFGSLFGM